MNAGSLCVAAGPFGGSVKLRIRSFELLEFTTVPGGACRSDRVPGTYATGTAANLRRGFLKFWRE